MVRKPAVRLSVRGSITWRLTLWYSLVLVVILVTAGMITYLAVNLSLLRQGQDRVLTKTSALYSQVMQTTSQEESQHQDLTDLDLLSSPEGLDIQIVAADGRVLNRSPGFPASLGAFPTTDGSDGPVLRQTAAGTFLVQSQPLLENGHPIAFLQVALPWEASAATLSTLRRFLILAGLVGLFLALAGGTLVARVSLRPVAEITRMAQAITREDLSQRLAPTGSGDELDQLVGAFNEMLDRIEHAFTEQRRFVADASHELRTPLAVIQGYAGILQRWGQEDDSVRDEAVAVIRREAGFLAKMVERLLVLASGDTDPRVDRETVNLGALLKEVAVETRVLAGEVNFHVGPLPEAFVSADPFLLKQLAATLLDNAFKYTPPGGDVRIALTLAHNQAQLVVSDTGEGIPAEDLPHIFERFYRVDKARSRQKGGSGLGLAIARWIAQAHGGEIEARSSPGEGSTFTVYLPLVSLLGERNENRPPCRIMP